MSTPVRPDRARETGPIAAPGVLAAAPSPPRRRRFPADGWAMLALAAVLLVANAPTLLGFSDPSPLGPRSRLVSEITPGLLPGERAIDPNDGFTSQALGHRAAIDLLHLRLPWWNPYEGTGAPLAGELQSAALFPPTLLTLLPNGQVYERVLLELVAGLSTFLLLRRLLLGRWASAGGGIAFALNGTFAWLAHAPINTVALMPALLLGIELAYAASAAGRRGGWWLIAVAGAGSFYAGFPEIAYVGVLFALCWFAWRGWRLGRRRLRAFARKGVCGAIVAVLLAAPLLVASLGYLAEASVGGHAGGAAGQTHLPVEALPQLVLPYVYGPIFAFGDPELTLTGVWAHIGGFLSTSLVALALLGLVSRGRRGLRTLLLAWILLVLARSYGQPRALSDVVGLVPGMSRVAFYRYGFPSIALATTILAAIGLDELAKGRLTRGRIAASTSIALALVVLAELGARPLAHELGSGYERHPYLTGSALWGGAIVVALAASALVRDPRLRIPLAVVVVAVDAVVLFALPQASAPRRVELDLAPVRYLQRHLGTSRFFTLGPLQPNYGSYFGIASLNVNDTPIPSAFATFVHERLDAAVDPLVFVGDNGGARPPAAPSPAAELLRNLAGYRAAGVAYVLAPAGTSLPESRTTFRLAFRSPSTWIYRLSGAAPYFTTSSPTCSVAFESRTSVQLSCPRPTLLVRRETALRGWSAAIDGRPAPLRRAEGVFQAVAVGAGTHRVTFAYAPPFIGWGLAAFALGCGALVVAGARSRRSA